MSIADIAAAQGSGQNRCLITHNTTWIVPTGVKNIWITACAAGEDGSNSDPDYIAKAGEFIIDKYVSVTPGQPIPIVVGRGNTVVGDLFTLAAGVLEGEWLNDKLGYVTGFRGEDGNAGGEGGAIYPPYSSSIKGNIGGRGGKGGYGGAFGKGGSGAAGGGGQGAEADKRTASGSTDYYMYVHQASSGAGGGAGGSVKIGKMTVANAKSGGTVSCNLDMWANVHRAANETHTFSAVNQPGVGGGQSGYEIPNTIATSDAYLDLAFRQWNLGEAGKDGGAVSGSATFNANNNKYYWTNDTMICGIGGAGGKGGNAIGGIGYGAGGGSTGIKGGGKLGGASGDPSKGAPGMVLIEW